MASERNFFCDSILVNMIYNLYCKSFKQVFIYKNCWTKNPTKIDWKLGLLNNEILILFSIFWVYNYFTFIQINKSQHWWSIGANGDSLTSLTPLVSTVNNANGTNESNDVIDCNVQWQIWNVVEVQKTRNSLLQWYGDPDVTIEIIFSNNTIVAIGIIVNIATIVWPMYHYCLQWTVIGANGANDTI